jgi:hypothetical protein
VLRQGPHHAIATEQKRECLDHGGLAAVVGTHKYRVLSKPDTRGSDAAKILDAQFDDLHQACRRVWRNGSKSRTFRKGKP